jgi:uncharacterized membrane protein
MRNVGPYFVSALFIASGIVHFRNPRVYEQIVPPYLPAHRALVYISGFFELLGAVGVLVPKSRAAAGFGLIALLVAVFPANVYMATDADKFAKLVPAWVSYLRLPLQPIAIWWIYNTCVKRR